MSEPKFTKGPWYVDQGEKVGYGIHSYHTRICIMRLATSDPLDIIATLPHDNTEEANAALIAAAPDMYWMLESLLDLLELNGLYAKHHEITELLKKARGEA